jgi:hypothetical protein
MLALRWLLGLIVAALGGGFLLLSIASAQFRRGFGASDISPLVRFLPLAGAALLLAGLIYPSSKLLLHAGALAAVALIGICIWQTIAEGAIITWLGVAYLVAWLVFYWLTAWKNPGGSPR